MNLRPNTGTYVSGAGHAAFLLYLIVGGLFFARETDLDVAVSNVSIISGEEFAAMQAQSPGSPDLPPAPQVPEETDQPAPAVAEDPPAPAPSAPPAPQEQTTPEAPPEVDNTPPPAPAPAPAPEGDVGAAEIAPDAVPTPKPAERVADEVVEAPDPDVTIDEVDQAAVAEEPADAPVVQDEAQQETAREEATTEIVTEADEPSRAPSVSTRPGRKPTPPAPQVAETPAPTPESAPTPQVAETPTETQPEAPSLQDVINDTVREAAQSTQENAVADNANPGGGTGAPITRAEKGAFILGIQRCWNVGALGTDALAVSVIVSFNLDQTAKPDVGSIRMVSSTGGSGDAVERAYEAARRAIIRCGANGYDLPLDKYDQWRQVQVSFNASRQEIR